jgi:hypothetical protein
MEKVNAKNFKQRGGPSSTGSVPSFQYQKGRAAPRCQVQ